MCCYAVTVCFAPLFLTYCFYFFASSAGTVLVQRARKGDALTGPLFRVAQGARGLQYELLQHGLRSAVSFTCPLVAGMMGISHVWGAGIPREKKFLQNALV